MGTIIHSSECLCSSLIHLGSHLVSPVCKRKYDIEICECMCDLVNTVHVTADCDHQCVTIRALGRLRHAATPFGFVICDSAA